MENVREYVIETTQEGAPFQTLKVLIYARGYRPLALDLSAQLEAEEDRFAVQLEPLDTVRIAGRVVLPPNVDAGASELVVGHDLVWRCEFFGKIDCLYGPVVVATAAVGRDGRFEVDLPDFAADANRRSFASRGSFQYRLVEINGENLWLRLDSQSSAGEALLLVPDDRIQP